MNNQHAASQIGLPLANNLIAALAEAALLCGASSLISPVFKPARISIAPPSARVSAELSPASLIAALQATRSITR